MKKIKECFLSLPKPVRFVVKLLWCSLVMITSPAWLLIALPVWFVMMCIAGLIDLYERA